MTEYALQNRLIGTVALNLEDELDASDRMQFVPFSRRKRLFLRRGGRMS